MTFRQYEPEAQAIGDGLEQALRIEFSAWGMELPRVRVHYNIEQFCFDVLVGWRRAHLMYRFDDIVDVKARVQGPTFVDDIVDAALIDSRIEIAEPL